MSDDTSPARSQPPTAAIDALSPAVEAVADRIFVVRGRRVMVDVDLALLYGVPVKRLKEQVKRNRGRFPDDFLFQLTLEEARTLLVSRPQIATLKRGHNLKYAPYAFTEHGAMMLAAVLNSPVAIEASIHVVRAFVRFRKMAVAYDELEQKLDALEHKFDHQFQVVFEAIRQLMQPVPKAGPRIGFRAPEDGPRSGDDRV